MTTKTIRTLLVSFETEIPAWKLSSFRGALIEKVGRQNQIFHNHTQTGYRYQYPLIQYKRVHTKASLYCLGDGVDEIHKFFGLRDWNIQLHKETINLKVERLDLNSFPLNVSNKQFTYSLTNWLALNEENYKSYKKLDSLVTKIQMLERLLIGNIISFAKGVGWHIDKAVEVNIQEVKGEKMVRYKGVPLLAFDVNFSSNVFLPNYLGLGKSASHGFGVVHSNKK